MLFVDSALTVASVKDFSKAYEDGKVWKCKIVDGIIDGVGCVSQFISLENIKLYDSELQEGEKYKIKILIGSRKNKLANEIIIEDTIH